MLRVPVVAPHRLRSLFPHASTPFASWFLVRPFAGCTFGAARLFHQSSLDLCLYMTLFTKGIKAKTTFIVHTYWIGSIYSYDKQSKSWLTIQYYSCGLRHSFIFFIWKSVCGRIDYPNKNRIAWNRSPPTRRRPHSPLLKVRTPQRPSQETKSIKYHDRDCHQDDHDK